MSHWYDLIRKNPGPSGIRSPRGLLLRRELECLLVGRIRIRIRIDFVAIRTEGFYAVEEGLYNK